MRYSNKPGSLYPHHNLVDLDVIYRSGEVLHILDNAQ